MFLIDPYRFGTPSVPDPYWADTNLLTHIDNIIPTDVVEDFSAYNLDGSLAASGVSLDTTRYKWGGGSANFTGSGRGIEVPIGITPFQRFDMNVQSTWEFWSWEDATGSDGSLASSRSTAQARGWILGTYFVLGYIDSTWNTSFLSWSRPAYATWNHIAIQTEGTTGANAMRVFVNGVSVAYGTFGTIENPTTPSSIQIGSGSSGGEYPFKGNLDDVRFTRGVARYPSGGFTPPAGPYANSA